MNEFLDNNDNDSKKININGTNNRYHINKLIKPKSMEAKIHKKTSIFDKSFENQLSILSFIHINKCIYSSLEQEYYIRLIKNKIASYRQQDISKKRYNIDNFVSLNYIIEVLFLSQLKCYYCNSEISIDYDKVRECKQWTLDRINNEEGHNINNVVISCLECNLKKRTTSKNAFLFTKNLVIIKK